MVDALVTIFDRTGGARGTVDVPRRDEVGAYKSEGTDGWKNASGWVQGEPCVDGWHGVTCCHEDFPEYRQLNGEWTCHRNGSFVGGAGDAQTDAPATGDACRSATPERHGARCVVVALTLRDNNLRGELPEALCALHPHLVQLDVRGNRLSGALPECVTSLAVVDLGDNDFWYVEADGTLRRLISRCRGSSSTYCTGVPPLSCDAFGPSYQVRSDDSSLCVACPPLSQSLLLQFAALLFFALLLVAYLRAVQHFRRLGEKLDLWINTAAIFFCHLQTVSIVGTLKLAWPPSVEALTEIASVDILSLGATRPECTLRLGDNSFYIFTIWKMVLLLVLVVGVSVAQSVLKACSPARLLQRTVRRVDQLEMAETVIFTFGLTLSWRVIFDLWEQGQSTLGLAKTSVGLASVLFVVQMTTLAKYAPHALGTLEPWLQSRSNLAPPVPAHPVHPPAPLPHPPHHHTTHPPPSPHPPRYAVNIRALITGRSFGRFANLSHERLKLRLSFLTERFGSHAPYWQYVVWLRQFLLTLDVWVCQLVMDDRDHVRGGGVAVCHSVELAADDGGGGANGTAANATVGGAAACRTLTDASLSAVYIHAAFAMLVFVVFGALQVVHRPFAYEFQNYIEAWLFAANVVLVGLGTIYTALKIEGEANEGVEALCIALLVCSLVAAAGYMVYRSRLTHLARRKQLAAKGCGSSRGNSSFDGDELGNLDHLKATAHGVAALRRAARCAAAATALSRISQSEWTENGRSSCGAPVMAGEGSDPRSSRASVMSRTSILSEPALLSTAI